ncbi:MAG: hypothetical protein IJA97_00470 [Clostridia bacterium]|nr:hypothetical protein [Clostridia bacterium]
MISKKCFGKLNISLKIVGVSNGYHDLDSIVMTVDKYDVVTVKKRRDDKILVTFTGPYAVTPKFQEETNAYKAAKLFKDTFNTTGVEVTVRVNIPTGGGLGSSSADIAGVLSAMKKLFKIDADIKPLSDSLGSDSGYLLSCGFARLEGRGDKVTHLKTEHKYYFVVINEERGVSTKECFALYDKGVDNLPDINTDLVIEGIQKGDLSLISKNCGNHLYEPAIKLNPEIEKNLNALKALSPEVCGMTGSGSSCFAMYESYEMASWAISKLKKTYGKHVELLSFYNPDALSIFDKMFGFFPPDHR